MTEIMYGMRENGRIVSINDIKIDETGLKCKCKCVQCHGDLQACSLNGKRIRYFRHHVAEHEQNNCSASHANESALHLMAKDILFQENQIALPPMDLNIYQLNLPFPPEILAQLPQKIRLRAEFILEYNDSVEIEKSYSQIRPDVAVSANGEKVLVEIAVTHMVDAAKLQKTKELDLPMLEIDLSKYVNTGIEQERLRQILVEDTDSKRWLVYPQILLTDVRKRLFEQATVLQSKYNAQKEQKTKEARDRQRREEEKRRLLENTVQTSADFAQTSQQDEKQKKVQNANYNQNDYLIVIAGQRWTQCTACSNVRKNEEFVFTGTPNRNKGLCKSCAKDWDNIVYHRTQGYRKRNNI